MRIQDVAVFAVVFLGIACSDSPTRSTRDPIPPSGITEAVMDSTPDASGKLALTIRVFGPGWAVGEPAEASLSCPYPYVGSGWRWSGVLSGPVSEDNQGNRSFRLLLTGTPDARVDGGCLLLGPVSEGNEGNGLLRSPLAGIPIAGVGGGYRLEVVSLSDKFGDSVGSPASEGVRKLTREKVNVGC